MKMNIFAAGIDWAEAGSTAGVVVLQGMLTIFLVLACIWFCIEVMHFVLHGREKKSSPAAPMSESVKNAESEKADASNKSEDDGAIIAVITAAIMAARAEEGHTGAFRVVSFKRSATAYCYITAHLRIS